MSDESLQNENLYSVILSFVEFAQRVKKLCMLTSVTRTFLLSI